MVNTEEKRGLPAWVPVVAIAAVLVGIVLYGIHVFRGQAPNSDLKMRTSYHQGASPSLPAQATPANH